MAHVHFSAGLRSSFTGGVSELVIEASNVKALIRALDERFPGIGAKLSEGTSVAIDGEIIPDADFEPLAATSEVHFLETIGGG